MNPPQENDRNPDEAPEMQGLLAQPGNQVPLRALLEAMRSNRPPIMVIGAERNRYRTLPDWPRFLLRQAKELEISPDDVKFDKLAEAIVVATSRLYLDDAVATSYGPEILDSPVQRSLRMLPYLVQDFVAATTNVNGLIECLRRADSYLRVISGELAPPYRELREDPGIALWELWQTSVVSELDEPPQPGSPWFIKWVDRTARSLLFIGLPPDDDLFDVLVNAPTTGPHFALLNSQIRSGELIRFLYARQIRPIWYDPTTTQLEFLLVGMAESMHFPAVRDRPSVWPVQLALPATAAARNTAAAESPAEASPPPAPTVPRLPVPELPPEVIDACLRNECVVFVGSGLSARAGIPTWAGFVEGLVDEAVALKLIGDDDAEYQRGALRLGEVNAVADNAISAFAQNREALFAYYRRMSTPSLDTPLPEVFKQLTQIPFAGILTTNYDALLAQAYAGHGLESLTPRDSERLLSLLSSGSERFLLQLYGNLDAPENVVFAPSDYQDLVRSNIAFSRFIEGLFFSRTMLFVGTSLEGLVDYLNAFQFPSGVPRQHFALVSVRGVGWQAMAQTLKRRYNIVVLPFSISPTFSELDEFLERLTQQTAHAASVVNSPAPDPGPRLLRIELRNIGPFKHLVLEFNTLWKVLLGDNGVGKSTILKAIAVAIVGSEGRQYAGRLLRSGETLGSVTVYTQKNPSGYVAEIQRVGLEAEVVTRSGRMLETEGWVALAFPPLRATSWVAARGPQGVGARHPTAADLLPILSGEVDARMDDLKQWLVNVDALSRKQGAPDPDRERAKRMLRSFFDIVRSLTEGLAVSFEQVTTDFRVLVKTPDGVVPIEALSQGLTSLLSWIGIVVQRLYEVTPVRPGADDAMQGYALILMDEIDAHMHPAWQQQLLTKLKGILPNVQVIATTHSPLVVAGLEVAEVTRYVRDETGAVVEVTIDEDMTEGRADQILTGDLFGLQSTFTLMPSNERLMNEYKVLLGTDTRTEEQERRFVELGRLLQDRVPPAGASTKLERRAQKLVHAVLEADYSTDGLDKLRTELLEKTRDVATSMGWTTAPGNEDPA